MFEALLLSIVMHQSQKAMEEGVKLHWGRVENRGEKGNKKCPE